ncbi:MAG: hypothetical protein ACRDZ8_13880 [Acidimicrobiales bacterium]
MRRSSTSFLPKPANPSWATNDGWVAANLAAVSEAIGEAHGDHQ